MMVGSVSGSSTGPLHSESRDPVPDLETQSLASGTGLRANPMRTVSSPGVHSIALYSRNIWIIVVQLPCNLLFVVLVIYTE